MTYKFINMREKNCFGTFENCADKVYQFAEYIRDNIKSGGPLQLEDFIVLEVETSKGIPLPVFIEKCIEKGRIRK